MREELTRSTPFSLEYGISSIEECKEITLAKGIDCDKIVREYPAHLL